MDTSRPTVRLGLGPHLCHVGREGGRQLQQLVTKVASMKLLDIKTGGPGHLAQSKPWSEDRAGCGVRGLAG